MHENIHLELSRPSDQHWKIVRTETNSEAALNFHYDYFENDKFSLSYSACDKGMSSPHPYIFPLVDHFFLRWIFSLLRSPEELTEIYLLQICPTFVTNVDAQNHKKNGLLSRFWKVKKKRKKMPRIKMQRKQNIELHRIKEWIWVQKVFCFVIFLFFPFFFFLCRIHFVYHTINVNVWLLRTMV